MTTAFNQDVIHEVKDRIDIVEIIGGYVQLKKRGRSYVGLCPFHNEKTPSFTVSPDKQVFYCFGCGAGGDVLTFLMKREGLSFPEALAALAARAGVELVGEEETPAARRQRELKERLYRLGAIAASFYYRILARHPAGAPARSYLQRRGIKGVTARQFELGFAPDAGAVLVNYLQRQGFTPEEIEQAGLSLNRPPRGLVDRFRGRLMFPIKDSRSRVIGFGGRVLGEGQPKYLNSPETILFHKGHHLFGLHLSLPGIRKEGRAILVEGYMDMIAAWQHGIDNVVASLGTSLTPAQARELKKYAREVIIAYDADTAGQAATLRGLDILAAAGLQVRVLQLPEGKDPDEFLAARGPEAFRELVAGSQGLMEFRIHKAVSEHDAGTAAGRKAIMTALLPYLRQVRDAVEQETYARLLNRYTGISETAILNDIRRPEARLDRAVKTTYIRDGRAGGTAAPHQAELFLLRAYLASPALATRIDAELGENWCRDQAARDLVAAVRERRRENPELTGPDLAGILTPGREPQQEALLARLTLAEDLGPVEERAVNKAIRLLKLQQLRRQSKSLWLALARAEDTGDQEQVRELQGKIFHLQQTINSLKLGRGELR
ncbi:DNA primase [Moorella thermoacetica]|uniref:DNA primase n=1 Tax=Neomoorella thermoacetica TaxID=1525 RepID=UPI0030D23929